MLSYLFYFVAVALVSAALGYGLGVTVVEAIGINFGLIVWLVGLVLAIIFLFGGLPETQLLQNPVHVALQVSPFWAIVFIVLAVLGIIAQLQSNRQVQVVAYNRWSDMSGSTG
ncbi:MAG: hypothetical protein JOZ87_20605 [Chloroflexi bacterium]|nr:hypothetical protein [Chloroflexota bacterium]